MSVYLILKVDSTSLDATQAEAVRAYAAQAFGVSVKIETPITAQEEKPHKKNPFAPEWDEELKCWVDPFGNTLINFG